MSRWHWPFLNYPKFCSRNTEKQTYTSIQPIIHLAASGAPNSSGALSPPTICHRTDSTQAGDPHLLPCLSPRMSCGAEIPLPWLHLTFSICNMQSTFWPSTLYGTAFPCDP